MNNIRRHHPVLQNRLRMILEAGDADALNMTLQQLSAADFRTAGFLLADNLLPSYPQYFWKFFLLVVPTHPKAYLVTFLKAALVIYQKDSGMLNFEALGAYAMEFASPVDKRKCLEYLLPGLQTVDEMQRLLKIFQPETEKAKSVLLLKAGTAVSYYLLFQLLQSADKDKETLRTYCIYLMKRGDSISFNMAVILQSYFDLPALPGTFSLKLEPYQLGRLNESFENFKKLLVEKI